MKTKTCATIRKFLGSSSEFEFRYIRLQLKMATDARQVIQDFTLTKKEFCMRMKIPESKYELYLNGGYNYDIKCMANLQAMYCELSYERDLKKRKEGAEQFVDVITK
jgi:hypothetical protein